MLNTIIFDLGNTLVRYFDDKEFTQILKLSIENVMSILTRENLLKLSDNRIWENVEIERKEKWGFRVRPLDIRLKSIFQLDDKNSSKPLCDELYRAFLKPVFNAAVVYEETRDVLNRLKTNNFKLGLISNSPWGSPAYLWREEIDRLKLTQYFDNAVFCGEVGWRKPDKRIFERSLSLLGSKPEDCAYVGDVPRWDKVGAENMGIKPVIIDRNSMYNDLDCEVIHDLNELKEMLTDI